MSLEQRLLDDLKAAMKSRNELETSVLRMLKSQLMLKKTEKEGVKELSDEVVSEVFAAYGKKIAESVDQFRAGKRQDLVERTEAELAVIRRYLPEPASEEQVRAVIAEVAASVGAAGPQDMGKVMGPAMARLKGRADGGLVSRLVREHLAGK
ncbi:GatB/YqeY domain-containing protein [bacterium]|nr:GatB/YqeY domain-containing protein [bacterium]